MAKFILVISIIFSLVSNCFAQVADSIEAGVDSSASLLDSVAQHHLCSDSVALDELQKLAIYKPSWALENGKMKIADVQQRRIASDPLELLVLLMVLSLTLLFVRLSFHREVMMLYEGIFNSNLEMQHLRQAPGDWSFSSVLLNANHLLSMSVFLSFSVSRFWFGTDHYLQLPVSISIILFTSMYVLRNAVIWLLGFVSEENALAAEYRYQMNNMLKTIGVMLIPIIMILIVSKGFILDISLYIGIAILSSVFFVYFFRGLSTGVKFMYKSVYHFFIYICLVEILPIVLTIKFLTKTVL